MVHHKATHHFLPHHHEDGLGHRAHAVSVSALFIYLQIFLIIAGGFYIIKLAAPRILGTVSFGASQIITITNAKRQTQGLAPLSTNPFLSRAAAAKLSDMFANDYWAHTSPTGKTPWSFITASGYRYLFAGENLARDFSDPQSVVEAWMNSPSHRNNILDKNFKEIGVAVESGKLNGREGVLVVQMFGAGVSQIPSEEPLAQARGESETADEIQPVEEVSEGPIPKVDTAPGQTASDQQPAATLEQTTVLASRQFSIAKLVSLILVGFIFWLFAAEVLITLKRTDMTVRAGVLAHLAILGFVLLAVWYSVQGAVI